MTTIPARHVARNALIEVRRVFLALAGRDRGLQHGVRACRESDHHGPRLIAWTGGCILAPLALVIDVFAVTHLVAPSPFDHSLLPAGAPGAGDKP